MFCQHVPELLNLLLSHVKLFWQWQRKMSTIAFTTFPPHQWWHLLLKQGVWNTTQTDLLGNTQSTCKERWSEVQFVLYWNCLFSSITSHPGIACHCFEEHRQGPCVCDFVLLHLCDTEKCISGMLVERSNLLSGWVDVFLGDTRFSKQSPKHKIVKWPKATSFPRLLSPQTGSSPLGFKNQPEENVKYSHQRISVLRRERDWRQESATVYMAKPLCSAQ